AGGRGDQHRDDLDLPDQDLVRDPLRRGAPGRPCAARGVRTRRLGSAAGASDRTGGSMTRVAVVGATGAVGRVMLSVLRAREFAVEEGVAFAAARSAGKEIDGRPVVVLDERADFDGFDIALFSAGVSTSREWSPRFVERGATVIDNSSAFRRDPNVPLV